MLRTSRYRTTRSSGIGFAAHSFSLQVGEPDNPGRPATQLPGRKGATADHPIGRRAAHLQNVGGFIQRHFGALGWFTFAVDRNAVGVPETADVGSCSTRTMCSQPARPIEDRSDCRVR